MTFLIIIIIFIYLVSKTIIMRKIHLFAGVILLITLISFTIPQTKTVVNKALTSWYYVGHFYDEVNQVTIDVYVDNDDPTQIVVGKYTGSSTIYFASGTYNSSDNTVTDFQMVVNGVPTPDPAYTGPITY